jgi:hypothetical protein
MGLFTSANADELYGEMGLLVAVCRERHGDYNFIAGYYESVISHMFADLPKRRQREIIVAMRECRARLEEESAVNVW